MLKEEDNDFQVLELNPYSYDIRSAMKKKLNITAGLRNFSFRLFLLLLIFPYLHSGAQTKSNLNIFFNLIDTLSNEIRLNIADHNLPVKLNFKSPVDYSILENRLLSLLIRKGIKVNSSDEQSVMIELAFSEASVNYSDSYRDGLFGNILVDREIHLSGNYINMNKNISKEFNYKYSDSIKYDELEEAENRAYPFTQNAHPSEPFFSSLIEPVIAVGAAATAVILFFTIRSK